MRRSRLLSRDHTLESSTKEMVIQHSDKKRVKQRNVSEFASRKQRIPFLIIKKCQRETGIQVDLFNKLYGNVVKQKIITDI